MKKSLATLAATLVVLGGAIVLFQSPAQTADVTLYKTPGCQCCEGYADHLRENGFDVTVKPTHDLVAMGREAGIPEDFQGCHLAFIDGYVVSGHVPVKTVKRLLKERPDIKGITLPGMPLGSPGMSGTKVEPFTIFQLGGDRPEVYVVE